MASNDTLTNTEAEELERTQDIPFELQDAAMDVQQTCIQGHKNALDHPNLQRKKELHGLHAYRFEILADMSVVALWANDEKGTVHVKAFADLEDAAEWTPRDER